MWKHLKNYFIPHEGNDHAPHFLRPRTITSVIAIILILEFGFIFNQFVVLPYTNLLGLMFPDVLVAQTNESRTVDNLVPLKINPILEAAARLKAQDMAEKGYFAHTSPESITPWYWFGEVGYKYAYAGENLAINFSDSSDVTNAWLNSPTHRANILNNRFTEIGVATAYGMYQGRETIFVVQLFGKPAAIAAVTPQPQIPAPITKEPETPKEIVTAEAPNETFIAVRGAEAGPEELITQEETREPTAAENQKQPGLTVAFIEKAVASPRTTSNIIFSAFGILVLAALALKILIKIRIQHPKLIFNGIMVVVLLGIIVLVNEKISLALAQIL